MTSAISVGDCRTPCELLFQARIHRDGAQGALLRLIRLHDLRHQRAPRIFRQLVRVLRVDGVVANLSRMPPRLRMEMPSASRFCKMLHPPANAG